MRSPNSPAMRRYMRRFWPLIIGYVVLALVVDRVLPAASSEALTYALALLTTAPLVAIIAALGAYLLEEDDEFLRARMVENLLWGLGAVLVISTVMGVLEISAGAPRLPLHWLFPIFSAVVGVAELIGRWRFR